MDDSLNEAISPGNQPQLFYEILSCIQASISDKFVIEVVTSDDRFDLQIKRCVYTIKVADDIFHPRRLKSRSIINDISTVMKTLYELFDIMVSVALNVNTFKEKIMERSKDAEIIMAE